MKILLTGANGYIGTRLMYRLLDAGHDVVALVRSSIRLAVPEKYRDQVKVIEADLLDAESLEAIPDDIDAAYYLVHSMGTSVSKFTALEAESALHFERRLSNTKARQIIYLSGIVNEEALSRHLASRRNVDAILRQGKIPVTTLMAGIIIGSGSASFEIIRDLVEKLPVMIAPRWTRNKVQPIAIRDVIDYLILVLDHPRCIGKHFEIGGPDVCSYKELLLRFAKFRGLHRKIINVPLFTPNLSSYWLYFITSASFPLARSLVESLKNNAICKEHSIEKIFPKKLLNFEEAVERAFLRVEEGVVPSSWKSALGDSDLNPDFSVYMQVPRFGTYSDEQIIPFTCSANEVIDRIWHLGGENGWTCMNWAWNLRGFLDRLVGGVGLRRGRTDPRILKAGDALDFWRVLVADRNAGRLLLYAEMKLPGEAWLEFKIVGQKLVQTSTFRPRGVWGRNYWYLLYPFHYFIFRGLGRSLVATCKNK